MKNSPSKSTILELLVSFRVVGEVLFGIFSQSHTLSLFLINNPEYIFWLIETETLSKKKTKLEYYKEAVEFLDSLPFPKKESKLRHYRKREYLRIAAKEIIKACSFEETMEELSNLADALVEVAADMAFEKLKKEDLKDGFAVIGLGKLGNKELNFSSDIDIMFVHREEDKSDIYNRIASLIVNILNQNKEGGFVFRVDTRLRPNGAYSPLSLSIEEYENYYATFGQVWEKLALIKARCVAGSSKLGDEFLKVVEPFVFKRTIDIEYIDEIRRLMFKIHKSSKGTEGIIPQEKQDIKKGKGGIREIEFVLNYFQLLYGGKVKQLRKVRTIDGLKLLAELGLLKAEESNFLSDAYLFFRRMEHKIQLLNEQQTQNLPTDEKSLKALAKKLNMELNEFVSKYLSYTDRVHEIFRSIFIVDKGVPVFSTADDIEGFLKEFGIDDAKTVALNIEESLKKFKATDMKPDEIQSIFDFAFEFTKDIGRFDRVVAGFGKIDPIYIKTIFKNRKLFELFLKLLSIDYAEKFIKYPSLLDSLVAPLELGFDSLDKKEKERLEFEIILKLLTDSYRHEDLVITTEFARALIRKVSSEFDSNGGLTVLGYGKLATGELFVGSDLDIVFVSKNQPYMYEPIVRRITKELKSFYEIDLRLRPFGDKGTLVCDVDYLKKYFDKDAQSWEKQAAQRSVVVYSGFEDDELRKIIKEFVLNRPPSKCEIFCMLKKIVENKGVGFDIKSSFGGLTTIDFFVQSLSFENECADIGSGTLKLIEKLKKKDIKGLEEIEDTYRFLFKVLNTARIAGLSSKLNEQGIKLVEFLLSEDSLKLKIDSKFKRVSDFVRSYFDDCSCD
ncbi:hypothetical protein [Hippea alviniae]|uniref:[protein-PII] uridylyltransferase family protein n=1 Tax=Hippea alviniae TaxID=1279027 RepID=UPI0003B43139|nr:hypothetical protein [Hippea alviniae]